MEFKGTKGEWKITSEFLDTRLQINYGDIDVWFGDATSDVNQEQAEANAQLIASAPDLLKALKSLIWEVKRLELSHGQCVEEELEEELRESQQAINKAINK